MRWMVGVDVRDLSRGAVTWAKWLAKRAPADAFVAVHVAEYIPTSFVGGVDPHMQRAALREMAEQALGPLREDETFVEIGALSASAAEDGLEKAVEDRQCDAFILGRRKPARKDTVVRLGRVARRMLRSLPRPVAIVPPDLDAASISAGPVLLATDLGPSSEGAARMARQLAKSLDLDLLVTHVVRVSEELSIFLPAKKWSEHLNATEKAATDRFSEWRTEHGLGDARHSVVTGTPTDKLLEVAKIAGASMIVVGSRGLETIERVFASSIGSELSASASRPVIVVPPAWAPPSP